MLRGRNIIITAGPTWSAIDAVRVISNTSTGALGQIMAMDFIRAGARVTLLEGPVQRPFVPAAKRITVKRFCFYKDLYILLKKELRRKVDIVIHAAAVSDYQLKNPFKGKLKSDAREMKLTLIPTGKIITRIKKWSPGSLLVGFKLESTINQKVLKAAAVNLMKNAGCDLVVANSLKGHYKAHIVNQDRQIIAHAASRAELSRRLIEILTQ